MPTNRSWQVEQCRFDIEQQGQQIQGLYLICHIDWPKYQYLEHHHLFNLKPAVKGNSQNGSFLPGIGVTLTLQFNPQYLGQLQFSKLENDELVAHWRQLVDNNQSKAPLIQTESWYLQSVAQEQSTGTVSYRTLWNYIDLGVLMPGAKPGPDLFVGVNQFFKESSMVQQALADDGIGVDDQLIEQAAQLFQSMIGTNDTDTTQPTSMFDQLIDGIFQLAEDNMVTDMVNDSKVTDTQSNRYRTSLLQTIGAFFVKEDWSFDQNIEKSVLRLQHTGEHGKWECYAKTQEDNQVFLFYSIPDLKAPKDKLLDVADYICRVNYGLVMGNLEIDFEDGEIRYKTSIDVEGDTLSFELIRNMVYANVSLMDLYLPGLVAIIEQDKSPAEALKLIE
ncbi:MAG: YbjN domain-containing protein [Cyanobacteria bacterium P01_D01_bin.56]